jgi:hypothetical protein
MFSIVLELQQNSLDSSIKTSDLLRKALVVAKKLNIEEDFATWINYELNGYPLSQDPPRYRVFTGDIEGWNYIFHNWQPVLFLKDPKQGEILSKCMCFQSIGEIESTLTTLTPNSRIPMPFSKEMESHLINSLDLPKIIRFIRPSSFAGVLDVVRTIVLNWSLKLEQDGILGQGLTFSTKEKEIATQSIYHVDNFYGNLTIHQGNNVSSTSINAQEDVNIGGDVVGKDKTSLES